MGSGVETISWSMNWPHCMTSSVRWEEEMVSLCTTRLITRGLGSRRVRLSTLYMRADCTPGDRDSTEKRERDSTEIVQR